jgi:hypothetical protein
MQIHRFIFNVPAFRNINWAVFKKLGYKWEK